MATYSGRASCPAAQVWRRGMALIALAFAATLVLSGFTARSANARPAIDVAWTQVAAPAPIADIGVGPGGEVWLTGADDKVYQWNGTAFAAVDGAATRVTVGPSGVAWIANRAGDVSRRGANGWDRAFLLFNLADIGISANGDLWGVRQDSGAVRSFGKYSQTTDLTTGAYNEFANLNASRVAVAPDGTGWVVTKDGNILRQVANAFQPVPGQAQDIGVGANGAVWITGPDDSISLWTGVSWDRAPGAGRAISVGPDGSPWVVNRGGNVFRGTPNGATAPTVIGPAPFPTPAAVTSRPVVALLCKYADSATFEPQTVAQVQAMFMGAGGIDQYIQQMSLGAANLAGTQTYGWSVLPNPGANYMTDDTRPALVDDCAAATPQAQIPDNAILAVFANGPIGPQGQTFRRQLTRNGAQKTYDVTVYGANGTLSPALVAHEFGHVFGMQHVGTGTGLDQNSIWDVMGAAPLGDDPINGFRRGNPQPGRMGPGYIAYHRDVAGWIPAGRKFVYAGTQQQITLTRLTLPTTNDFLMAQIPIGGGPTFYTVEARMWAGADGLSSGVGTLVLTGNGLPGEAVIIHRIDPSAPNGTDAQTVTTGPNDRSDSEGAMWRQGKTFTDQANNISIRVDTFDPIRGIALVTIGPANP